MIARDSKTESVWQPDTGPFVSRDSTETLFDVAIIGAGMTGINAGLQLQKAGKKCVILEAHNIGYGTTGGTTAHLNTLLDTPYTDIIKNFGLEQAKLVAASAKKAISMIESNIQEHGISCEFERTNAFLFSQNEKQDKELTDIHDACHQVNVNAKYIHELPVPMGFGKILQVADQGKFHPLRYLYGIASAFEDAGGVIRQDCRVQKLDENEPIEIQTSCGVFYAGSVIYATHIPPGVNLLHLRCSPWRSYSMTMTLEDEKYPLGLIYDMYDPYHYYRSQIVGGKKVLIAGGYDHKVGHEENTTACFNKLESHVRRYFKVAEITARWSSEYFEPADGLPYIGHLPGAAKNIYVATGYGGNGMIYSHVASLLLRDIILKKKNKLEPVFSPARIKPVAGFSNFISNNAGVAKNFLGRLFNHEALDQLASLAPGEGKVVDFNGETIAISKDDNGQLHAVSSVCTHLGCRVAWNLAERSWDCPCHGARYSCDGKVLNGPADRDLEPISLNATIEKVQ